MSIQQLFDLALEQKYFFYLAVAPSGSEQAWWLRELFATQFVFDTAVACAGESFVYLGVMRRYKKMDIDPVFNETLAKSLARALETPVIMGRTGFPVCIYENGNTKRLEDPSLPRLLEAIGASAETLTEVEFLDSSARKKEWNTRRVMDYPGKAALYGTDFMPAELYALGAEQNRVSGFICSMPEKISNEYALRYVGLMAERHKEATEAGQDAWLFRQRPLTVPAPPLTIEEQYERAHYVDSRFFFLAAIEASNPESELLLRYFTSSGMEVVSSKAGSFLVCLGLRVYDNAHDQDGAYNELMAKSMVKAFGISVIAGWAGRGATLYTPAGTEITPASIERMLEILTGEKKPVFTDTANWRAPGGIVGAMFRHNAYRKNMARGENMVASWVVEIARREGIPCGRIEGTITDG